MSLSEEILVEILCCCDAPVVGNACRTDRLLRRVGQEERICTIFTAQFIPESF